MRFMRRLPLNRNTSDDVFRCQLIAVPVWAVCLSTEAVEGFMSSSSKSPNAINVLEHPLYIQLLKTRRKITLPLLILSLVSYYGLILAGAFIPKELGLPIIAGTVTSWGVVLGFTVIIGCLIITGIYVHCANKYLEPIMKKLKEQVAP
jgi:uncharacterized membrane protein (DUF485 family)